MANTEAQQGGMVQETRLQQPQGVLPGREFLRRVGLTTATGLVMVSLLTGCGGGGTATATPERKGGPHSGEVCQPPTYIDPQGKAHYLSQDGSREMGEWAGCHGQ